MAPTILYQFQQSKAGTPDGGDDRMVVTDHFAAVVDGATSKAGVLYNGQTSGAFVADVVVDGVRAMPHDIAARDAVDYLSAQIQNRVINAHAPHMNDAGYAGDRPCAAMAVYSAHHRQIWRVGDTPVKIGETIHAADREIDRMNATLRAAYLQAMLGNRAVTVDEVRAHDVGRDLILPLLTAQSVLANNVHTPLGYGVMDGRPVPDQFIEIFNVGPATHIMLCSDGVLGDLRNHDDATMNMDGALVRQREYYKNDPLMIGAHPSTKGVAQGNIWHDDITILELKI